MKQVDDVQLHHLKGKIYLSPPHLGEEEQALLADAIASNWIAPLGYHVEEFELELAQYVGSAGAVAVSSGTAALHLALRVLGVTTGDVVFCSTLTFVASANPILYQGATPVFIDSEPASWNMSPVALERALHAADKEGKLPKAVILVHLFGQSADMKPIQELCDAYGVALVEDAAESLGATYQGKKVGTFGRFGMYSFNGNKLITTSGGGMLVTDDPQAIKQARHLAAQARDPAPYYLHSQLGYNYRLSNLLAAVGRGQLRVIEERIAARRQIFARYAAELSEIEGVAMMPEAPFGRSTRWLSVLTLDPKRCPATPAMLIDALQRENIEARRVWQPMHRQPLYEGCKYFPHQESVSDHLFATGVCLPSGSSLTSEEQERVISSIKRVLKTRS